VNSDPATVTRAQVKQALAVLGLADERPGCDQCADHLHFVSLVIERGTVTICRLRFHPDGRLVVGSPMAATETTVVPIRRSRDEVAP
jgi:hypothetical protein